MRLVWSISCDNENPVKRQCRDKGFVAGWKRDGEDRGDAIDNAPEEMVFAFFTRNP